MARIELAPQVAEDLERILDHLMAHEATRVEERMQAIMTAISVLEDNPLLGSPVGEDLRELVIGHLSQGYVALYRHVPELELVFVLAVKSQREAGYPVS